MSRHSGGESMEPDNLTPELPAPVATPQRPGFSAMFLGPHGLRAGWRFAIYLAAVFALATAFSFINRPFVPHRHELPPLWLFLLGECESLAAGVIPAVVLAHFEKRRFDDYGLPRQGAFGKNFFVGIIWGLVAISALLLALRGVGVFYFGRIALHGIRILKFAAFWGVFFLIVGLFEEFVTRGYSQFTLAQGVGFWPAAFLLSIAFGAIHLGNQGEAWLGALGAAFIGLFFCLTLRRTGTLWFAVGMHASWDWGETFLYSVPDSGMVAPGHLMNPSFHGSRWLTGGSVGPEGSVLLFVLITAMWILFDRMYPAKRAPANQLTTETPSPS
jgi:uncharacterized protein